MKILVALLLTLLSGLASCQFDLSSKTSIGSIDYKGSKLSVFEIDGIQFTEPSIQFTQSCATTTYNHLYQKYQLGVSVLISVNALEKAIGDSSKRVGQLTISKLGVISDEALANEDSKTRVLLKLENPSEAQLLFLCDEFERCEKIRIELIANPTRVQNALEFTASGVISSGSGGIRVKFGGQTSSNPPPIDDCLLNRWIVFQRRIDGSLSFAQNWDTYVKGFGNPHGNYWMGLNQLFASTASSEHNGHVDTARCELRVEAKDHSDNSYWGQFKIFQVMSPDQNYRLRVMNQVIGTNIEQVTYHHERQFSTYDKHNGGCPSTSCSRHFGYAGWWFPGITLNANGAYTTDESAPHSPTYFSALIHNKYVPMKSMVMMFRCK